MKNSYSSSIPTKWKSANIPKASISSVTLQCRIVACSALARKSESSEKSGRSCKPSKMNQFPEESFLQTFASYMGATKHANAKKLEDHLKHTVWETVKSG